MPMDSIPFPHIRNPQKHDYVYDNFILKDDQEVVYVDDTDQVLSRKGIDVSKHQGKLTGKGSFRRSRIRLYKGRLPGKLGRHAGGG